MGPVDKNIDGPGLEALLESGEAVADQLMRDNVLAEIPVFGVGLKILRAADALRARIYAAKVHRFLLALDTVKPEEIAEFKTRLQTRRDEAKKAGETLFFVIERLTDMEKPYILGCVFISYLRGSVTTEEIRRLARAIDLAFIDDLKGLLEERWCGSSFDSHLNDSLQTAGLLSSKMRPNDRPSGFHDAPLFSYQPTDLGRLLQRAYADGRKPRLEPLPR